MTSAESQVSTQVRTVSTAMSNSLSVSINQSFTEDKTDHSTTSAVTSLHYTLVKSQPTITPTSVSYGTPDSGMHIYYTRLPRPSLTSQTSTDYTSPSVAKSRSQNARENKWFYFVLILIIPIGMSFALLYRRKT